MGAIKQDDAIIDKESSIGVGCLENKAIGRRVSSIFKSNKKARARVIYFTYRKSVKFV